MSRYLKHHPVNWIDGMKINKQHFLDAGLAQIDYTRDAIATSLNYTNFGILPNFDGDNYNLRISIAGDNQEQIKVNITTCNAVTLGGARIIIDKSNQDRELIIKVPNESEREVNNGKSYYIVLSVDSFNLETHGTPLPSETPPRIPYLKPTLQGHLLEEEAFNNQSHPYHLVVGKLNIKSNTVEIDENYIPPIVSIRSHQLAEEFYYGLLEFYGKLERISVKIINKIYRKEQKNIIALIVKEICEEFLSNLNTIYSRLRLLGLDATPVYCVEMTSGLARSIKNIIDIREGVGKDELLDYFVEWCELNQGAFEKNIAETVDIDYNHNDINSSFEIIVSFANQIYSLFNKLSELEYIGKKSETNIFVKEEKAYSKQEEKHYNDPNLKQNTPEPKKPKRRSFLAD